MEILVGCVENRLDPLKLGRCQVRIVGLHTEDKIVLPTLDLPWAYPMGSVNSASMSGIGYSPVGPVEGTWVVVTFLDEDQQQPIIMGTIGGIPQSKAAQIAESDSSGNIIGTDGGFLINSDGSKLETATGAPIVVGSQEAQNNPPPDAPTSEPPVLQPVQSNFDKPIPLVPPPGDKKFGSGASAAISAIISACSQVGLTSKYAQCSVLAICAVESTFKLVAEGSYYKEASALSNFGAFRGKPELAQQYTKCSDKAAFFEVVYGYKSSKGKELGNNVAGDGGKYYGRGYIQITGKANYTRYQSLLNKAGVSVEFVNNPDMLLKDVNTGALVAAMYIKDRVKCPQTDEGFFAAARRAVGNNIGTSYQEKQKYYEYFMGEPYNVPPTDKSSVNENKRYTSEEIAGASKEKRSALSEDRTDSTILGFRDPYGKYPLRHYMHEPDTSRLARGNIEDTAVAFKDATRVTSVAMANSSDTWRQPFAPYSAQYPYNHVYESESGHVMEFDDSPNGERINLYHRKGTYIEMDAQGSQVNRIIGDGYTIIDNNGAIYIGGSAYLTVDGSINILVQGNADVQVDGAANINLHNDANIGVGKDLKIAVGGDIDISAGGHIRMESGGDAKIKAGGGFSSEAKSGCAIKSDSDFSIETTGSYAIKAKKTLTLQGNDKVNISGVNIDILANSNLNMDYALAELGNFKTDVPTVEDFKPEEDSNLTLTNEPQTNKDFVMSSTLSPPEARSGSGGSNGFLPDIVRDFGEIEKYPDIEELEDPLKRYEKDNENAGIPPEILSDSSNVPNVIESVGSVSTSGKSKEIDSSISNSIKSTSGFSAGYTISKHFQLGHVCLGGGLPSLMNKVQGNRFYGNAGATVNLTDKQIVENLAYMAENILERLYELEGPPVVLDRRGTWNITSGYRPGFARSEHGYGHAIDIQPVNSNEPTVVYEWAKRLSSQLVYNQFLFEHLDNRSPRNHRKPNLTRWLHISYRKQGNSQELATMLNDGDSQVGGWFKPGLICLDDKPKT